MHCESCFEWPLLVFNAKCCKKQVAAQAIREVVNTKWPAVVHTGCLLKHVSLHIKVTCIQYGHFSGAVKYPLSWAATSLIQSHCMDSILKLHAPFLRDHLSYVTTTDLNISMRKAKCYKIVTVQFRIQDCCTFLLTLFLAKKKSTKILLRKMLK